jgi:hypothetical protein
LSNEVFLDGQEQIVNEITTSPFHDKLNRMSVHSLQIDFEAATGLISGQGEEPTVMLQYSKDGGYNWITPSAKSIGKIGDRLRRCKWNKLGMSRNFVFKVRCSDPVFKVLMGAIIEVEDTGS